MNFNEGQAAHTEILHYLARTNERPGRLAYRCRGIGRETFDRGNARIIRRTSVSTSPKSESLQSSGRVEYGVAAMQRRAPPSKGRACHSEIFSNGFYITILEPESPAVPLLPVHPTHNEFMCIHVHPIGPPNPRIAKEPLIVQAPYVAQDG